MLPPVSRELFLDAYIDDIIVFSDSRDEHLLHLDRVLQAKGVWSHNQAREMPWGSKGLDILRTHCWGKESVCPRGHNRCNQEFPPAQNKEGCPVLFGPGKLLQKAHPPCIRPLQVLRAPK